MATECDYERRGAEAIVRHDDDAETGGGLPVGDCASTDAVEIAESSREFTKIFIQ